MSATVKFTRLSPDCIEVVSRSTINILEKAAEASNNYTITITSTIRTPERQVNIMYKNLENGIRIKYAAPGRQVEMIYDEGKSLGWDPNDIKKEMITKTRALSAKGERVSRHCVTKEEYQKRNIVDVSKFIPNPRDFVKALLKENRVKKVITPYTSSYNDKRVLLDSNEPAIHIEVEV